MPFLLQEEFIVSFDWKRRNYVATLTTYDLTLKPVDVLRGKIIRIPKQTLVSCQSILGSDSGDGLFALTAFEPDTFRQRVLKFHPIEQTTVPEQVSLIWVNAIQTHFPLHRNRVKKSVLVLVNPKAGQGASQKMAQKICPILEAADLVLNVIITKHGGHGQEIVKHADLDQFGMIVIFSGDGIIHETLNGLHQREDASAILNRIAVVPVPVGSGNGLNRSLIHASKNTLEGHGVLYSVLNILRGQSRAIDSFRIQQFDTEDRHAFLSLTYGMIADIDIESEDLRVLGKLRFTLWAFHRIAQRRFYHARLSYLVSAPEVLSSPLPDLDDHVPDSWITEEDTYTGINFFNLPYIGEQNLVAPECTPNDGKLWALIVRKDATRGDLLKIISSIETGDHVKVRGVEVIPVFAFRLEPLDDSGILSLDGESIPCKPVQGCIEPKSWRTLF